MTRPAPPPAGRRPAPARADRPARAGLVELGNDRLRLGFLPSLGGRLLSLRIDGMELLWRDEAALEAHLAHRADPGAWINAGGSKTWPAPQHAWGGPPGPIDGDPFATHRFDTGAASGIRLTSPPDPRTGLEVVREFELPRTGAGFRQRTTFRNHSRATVTWAIWEVCQLAADPGDRIEVDADDDAPVAIGETVPAHRDGNRWSVPLAGAHGKIGFPGATGRAGCRREDGAGFDWRFDPEPGRPHPDADSRVTVYVQAEAGRHPRSTYAELELLSALAALPPGATIAQRIDWTVIPPSA